MDRQWPEWGKALERWFRENPDLPPKPFLAFIEQNAKQRGDLDMLREIKAYRTANGID